MNNLPRKSSKPQASINIDELKEFLYSGRGHGRVTREIADKFNLTNRTVGGIMGNLKRKGLVFTYTKCTVTLTNFLSRRPEPFVISNSYYEWIGE